MTSSPYLLDDCSAKLVWARVHIEELENEVAAYFKDGSPNSPRADLDGVGNRVSRIIQTSRPTFDTIASEGGTEIASRVNEQQELG